jgi:hypothetical protein
MPVVHARIRVDADGTISGKAPQGVPAGEYETPIEVAEPKRGPKRKPPRPAAARLWPVGRQRVAQARGIYGDDGR